jgi:hypothetical protein
MENKDKLHMPTGRNYPLNYKIGMNWAQHHCDVESTNFATQIVKNTIYVSFAEFIQNLEDSCKSLIRYYKKKKDVTFILIIPHSADKSNMWVSLLAYPWIHDIIHDIHFTVTSAYNEYVVKKQHTQVVCIMCDDCAYTGNQISDECALHPHTVMYDNKPVEPDHTSLKWVDWFKTIIDNTKMLESEIDINKFSINLIIPYMSTLAQQKVAERHFIMVPSNVKVFKMFRERVNMHDYSQGVVREFESTFQYHTDISAIYFDHKIADAVSTFNKIYLLAPVFNCGDLRKSICFIEGCCEPSKLKNNINPYNVYLNVENNMEGQGCPSTYYKSINYTINKKKIETLGVAVSNILK